MLTTLRISGFAIVDAGGGPVRPRAERPHRRDRGRQVDPGERPPPGAGRPHERRGPARRRRRGGGGGALRAPRRPPGLRPPRGGRGAGPAAGRAGRAAGPAGGPAGRARPGLRQRRAGHRLGAGARRCAGWWTSPASTSTSRCSTRRPTSRSSTPSPGSTRRPAVAALLARYREAFGRSRPCAGSGTRCGATRRSGPAGPTTSPSSSRSSTRSTRSPARTPRSTASGGCWPAPRSCARRRGAAEGLVYGEDGSASEQVGQAVRALADAAALDPRLGGAARSCSAPRPSSSTEAGRELGRYADGLGGDRERLQVVEDRLEALKALCRKHGGSLEAAVARRDGDGGRAGRR